MTQTDESCPLCGEPFGDRELSVDHIFGESFGGRATVQTHRSCNNTIGGDAEGRLHRPGSIFNVAKLSHGLEARPLDGEMADGQQTKADLASGTWSPSKPTFSKVETDDAIHVTASGSPEQLAKMVKDWQKKWPGQVPSLEELRARTEQLPRPAENVELKVDYDLNDTLAVLKKAALGAGIKAFGTSFAIDPLAEKIRNAEIAGQLALSEAPIGVWDVSTTELDAMSTAGLDVEEVPPVLPAPKHQVVFMPIPGEQPRTAVYVYILGVPLEPAGIIIAAPIPDGTYGPRILPVMIREVDALAVWDINEIMMGAISRQEPQKEGDIERPRELR